MTLKKRIIILAVVIVAFFLSVPIAIYYAIGYTFDFEQWRLIKTGILLVNTNPNGAQILLDGKIKTESPARIRFLLPKDYDLEIKKEGYVTWKKSISISPQQITHLSSEDFKIYLFLKDPEKTLVATSTQQLIESDLNSQVSVATSTIESLKENLAPQESPYVLAETNLYAIIGDEIFLIQQDVQTSYWTDGNKLLLYANNNNIWILDPSSGEKSELIVRSQQAITNPQYNTETRQVFYIQEGKIKTIEANALFGRNITEIVSEELPVLDFFVNKKGENITYMLENGDKYLIKIR